MSPREQQAEPARSDDDTVEFSVSAWDDLDNEQLSLWVESPPDTEPPR